MLDHPFGDKFKTILLFLLITSFSTHAQTQSLDPKLLSGISARSIGPAGMSGRVAAIDAVINDRNTIYIGAATGGLWKSQNAGLSWTPLFDKQNVASIGAISIFQTNPDIVWVGTGEGNPRNSASVGRGIFRSLDGGHTWQNMGLNKSERIHRIITHPTNPDIVYVAALGQAWGENAERGVFKTIDGGQNWQKILYIDEKTGAADLIMDPQNPNKLFAAMWQFRRWPWSFKSGGPGSGLHLSHDGGKNWKQLNHKDGLPKGELGRIGLAISQSNPNMIYALIEAEKSALIRSNDGGISWQTRNTDANVASRPFYYTDIRVDPQNPNRLYRLESLTKVSEDGGKTFSDLIPWASLHPDHHAMWIDPNDGRFIIDGNDGGIGISHDQGQTWRFASNLPLAQFYHIAVDNDYPYHVYGGMQDNGSWRGPGEVWETNGIRNHHWDEVAFGDGFDTRPDPENSRRGYGMSQDGYLIRWNLDTGERKLIRPAAAQTPLRFNWNAGFAQDPFKPATIYYGSQFIHRSDNRGDSWKTISKDLTSNNPEWQQQAQSGGLTPDVTAAENFTSITNIAPSTLEPGIIWAGTDDGRIHITVNAGEDWQSLETQVKTIPDHTWVAHIHPSAHEAGTAFIAFDNHRRSDWESYAYRVEQYGKRWTRLNHQQIDGYVLSIVQDHIDPEILYLGSEFGLFISFDSGKNWIKWTHGLPTVAVKDLALQQRDDDLVIGTHGRSAYVIDDLSTLRALKTLDSKKPLSLLPNGPAQQYRVKQTAASRFPGAGEFYGENEPYGALISLYINDPKLPHPDPELERVRDHEDPKDKDKHKLVIKISDDKNKHVRRLEFYPKQGLNRFNWDLKRDSFGLPARQVVDTPPPNPGSFEISPGDYQVTLVYGEHQATSQVKVLADPRFKLDTLALESRQSALEQAGQIQHQLVTAIDHLQLAREDIQRLQKLADIDLKTLNDTDPERPLKQFKKQTESTLSTLQSIEKKLWHPPDTKGIPADTVVWARLSRAFWFLESSWDQPTQSHLAYLAEADAQFRQIATEYNQFFEKDIAALRKTANELKLIRLLNSKLIEPRPAYTN